MNMKKILIRSIFGLYVILGLLVATQGGLTRETLRKINTQKVRDQIIEVKKAYKNDLNEIMICYSAHRTNDPIGLGKDDEIENWLIIPVEEWKLGKRRPYYNAIAENSSLRTCSEFSQNLDKYTSLKIKNVDRMKFDDFFSRNYRAYEEAAETLYVKIQDRYLKIGYVNNLNDDDIVAFKIFTPDIIIEGDNKQILFLPFALLADVISWPVKVNNFFNSNLSI